MVCQVPQRDFFPMEVILLTTLFSVLFAILFLLLFLRARQHGEGCADQDALLPFLGGDSDEKPADRRGREGDPDSTTISNQPASQDDQ